MKATIRESLVLRRQQRQMERALPPATIALPPDAVGTPVPEAICPSSPMRAPLLPNPSSLSPAPISVSLPPSSPVVSPSGVVTYTSPDPSTSVPPVKDEFVSQDIQTLLQGATYRLLQAEHEAASYYLSSALMEDVEGVLPSSSPSSSPLFPILSSGETSSIMPQSSSPPLSSRLPSPLSFPRPPLLLFPHPPIKAPLLSRLLFPHHPFIRL